MLDLFLYTCCYSISSLQSPSYSFPLSLFNSNGGSEPQTRDLRAQQWQHEDSPHQSRMHHHLLICSRKRWFFFSFQFIIFSFSLPSIMFAFLLIRDMLSVLKGCYPTSFSASTLLNPMRSRLILRFL